MAQSESDSHQRKTRDNINVEQRRKIFSGADRNIVDKKCVEFRVRDSLS